MRKKRPEDAPVALLVHPMLVDERCFRPLTRPLARRYRFVLPTLDRHYDGPSGFASAAEEARAIAASLQGRGIDRIEDARRMRAGSPCILVPAESRIGGVKK